MIDEGIRSLKRDIISPLELLTVGRGCITKIGKGNNRQRKEVVFTIL
jgi:hypothetical protein